MRSRHATVLFSRFFDPQVPFLFWLGSVVLAVVGNGVHDLLLGILGDSLRTVAIITVVAAVCLFVVIAAFLFVLWLRLRTAVPDESL